MEVWGVLTTSTMRWSRWKASIIIFIINLLTESLLAGSSHNNKNFRISPKPCVVSEIEGTCMFVWECIKSEGTHLGMCMDGFMFGSCCAHNLTDNFVLPPSTPFRPQIKPTSPVKLRPSNKPNKPNHLAIQRPNGSGTLVIRQPLQPQRPFKTKPTRRPPTKNPIDNFNDSQNELSVSASVSANTWSSKPWQVTTEPNFITKPRPSPWDKTTPSRPKQKPTKKPITYISTVVTSTRKPTTFKPKPPVKTVKPITTQRSTTTTTTTTTTTLAPITRPITRFTSKKPSTIPSTELLENTIPSKPLPPLKPIPGRDTLSASRNIDCGLSTVLARPETRIVGGKNAPFGRYPWQVSVRRTSFFGFSSTHRCGGAVLNENFIATAGHCVDDLLTSQIRIRVGEYDFSHVQEQLPYIERAVSKKIVHPKYNFYTYEYDLALVKLEQPLEFAPHISPICLPATDDLLIGQNGTVTGWGRLSEGGTLPSILQEVSVPIVSNDRCKTMFLKAGRHEFIPEIFLCAGHEKGQSDSCQGDSGGPLQVKGKDGHYFLAGIISWGIGCAEANLPGVCTRISKFTPWILENVS
ncbi:CLUMA_CG015395, isoform A [Clunio marinus]|uniref:CLUMA_CG015395, isoform A n=1 Tax=Clunio marinus TaxID=568069 RepID=A0A1J1IQA0_9DIPT|nr:CLUMA_CG015395, isoform A [Clunio marinus]